MFIKLQKHSNRMGHTIYEYIIRFGFSVVLIALLGIVLYKGGLFDPARFLPNHCRLETPLACDNLTLTTNSVSFNMHNGLDRDINITHISVGGCSEVQSFMLYGGDDRRVMLRGCSFKRRIENKLMLDYTLDNQLYHVPFGSVRGYVR